MELQKVFHENNLESLRDVNINFYPQFKKDLDGGKTDTELVQQGDTKGPVTT